MKATESIADFVTRTGWKDVPDEAHQRSKWAFLDCVAARSLHADRAAADAKKRGA